MNVVSIVSRLNYHVHWRHCLSIGLACALIAFKSETVLAQESSTGERLKEVVVHLSETIGERNLRNYQRLDEAADYLEKTFQDSKYSVERQTYQVDQRDCHNLIVEIKGTSLPDEIVLVGAHYDSAYGTPGANDNGSGTAALVVLAEKMQSKPLKRTVRFVAFTNEEPPHFQREEIMGSWVYAKACRQRKDKLVFVLSLETMGYFTDEPFSQQVPPPLNLLYPNTGNFIAVISNPSSRPMMMDCLKVFRKHCKEVKACGGPLPEEMHGVGWSDHWSFWQEGYSGIMITDTALFRYPHYHEPTDTVDKIDFKRFSQVVDGLTGTITEIADR